MACYDQLSVTLVRSDPDGLNELIRTIDFILSFPKVIQSKSSVVLGKHG